ncbi:hypothetical protein KW784_01290 [Candidatus Parcubacteria bacterium]|nr:hypothetical protein [Candidatus Parcubacteria bacterium]
MKKSPRPTPASELPMSESEFIESFNRNMPEGYPRVSLTILKRFKEAHGSLFKGKGAWSLDQHRKRMIEWLPQNLS